VTDVPGTTRDLLTEKIDVHGVPVTLVDTAGMRGQPTDVVEEEGIVRAHAAATAADVVLVLVDGSRPLEDDDRELIDRTGKRARILVATKCDLPAAWDRASLSALPVSALTDDGVDALRGAMLAAVSIDVPRDRAGIANLRHAGVLEQAQRALTAAAAGLANGDAEEFVLADLHEARAAFDEIVGIRTPDDVLDHIFTRFCIGK
jgi:tRNA modification GTPase